MKTFSYNLTVQLDDLDYMNHVGHTPWLVILERARVNMVSQVGYPASRMFKEGVGCVVAELSVKFKRPARFESNLSVRITPTDFFEKGVLLQYEVVDFKTEEKYLEASTKMIFVNAEGRPCPIPHELKVNLQ